MSLKPTYPKKRYKIEFIDGQFVMSGPYIEGKDEVQVWMGKSARALANQAFDSGADEVAHNYDLGIVDSLGKLR